MKSKGDFIIDLLNSKKLSNLEKDRVLNLTAKEYEKNEIELENISKLILNLEHRTQSQHNLLKKEYESLISLWKKHIEKSDKKINQLHEIVSKVVQKVKKSNITLSELEQNEFWKKPNPKHVADFMSLFNHIIFCSYSNMSFRI